MSKLFDDLNDKQREAVTAPLGPVLILAGAGSGKTRALTYRIAYLIGKKMFSPDEILALTFTNKAATEMKRRVQTLLAAGVSGLRGAYRQASDVERKPTQDANRKTIRTAPPYNDIPSITMGTFHSVCVRILRADIEKLKAGRDRNFVIYDSDDQLKLIKQITLEMDLAEEYKPQVFSYFIGQAKNRLTDPMGLDLGKEYFQEKVQQVFEEYQKRLLENNALDFDDLLNVTVQLFQKQKKVLEKYRERFRYILVDEYQDTNHAQYLLLKLLSEKHKNLFVVGDDAQSIYGFRGANMQNILDFKKDYKKATVIKLEQNYRSSQNILDAANVVIKINSGQYEKRLWTENGKGDKVYLYEAQSDFEEGNFVVESLLGQEKNREIHYVDEGFVDGSGDESILAKYMRQAKVSAPSRAKKFYFGEQPKNLNQTVVLYRTHAQSRAFEEALMNAGIPYQIVGGIRFYERKEIKDVLAYLRLVTNGRDLVGLSRVINEPRRGIGLKSFGIIKKLLKKFKFDFARLYKNLEQLELSAKALDGAERFFRVMSEAGQIEKEKNILDLMDHILLKSGFKEGLLDGSEEGEARWENVEELYNVAAKYKNRPWQEGLHLFLEEAALMSDLDQVDDEENRLTLMTLHSAKGLEFDRVFFVGLEEGLLPHSRSIANPEELSEEIRLAYVGMTRARKQLYLSFARSRQVYGETRRSVPSRVLKVIPKKLIQKLN
jgi:DNA helicase-2/ATP-dependent DNA helicase PcrA